MSQGAACSVSELEHVSVTSVSPILPFLVLASDQRGFGTRTVDEATGECLNMLVKILNFE